MMKKNNIFFVCVVLFALNPYRAQAQKVVSELTKVSVTQADGATKIDLEGSGTLSPNIFKLQDQDRIVVDLTDTKMGSKVESELNVNINNIKSVSVNQFDHSNTSLTRVVISLSGPGDYKTETQGNTLSISVLSGSSDVLKNTELTSGALENTQQFSADVSPIPEGSVLEPNTVSPFSAGAPVSSPVGSASASPATELVDIQVSSSPTGTTVTLIGNGVMENYDDFVLSNPRRVVIDLDSLKNGFVGSKTIAANTPEISKIRLGGSDQKIRVVLDSKTAQQPSYTITKEGSTLVLRVASLQSQRTASQVEAPGASITASDTSLSTPTEPLLTDVAPAPTRVGRTVTITGLSFKQLKSDSKSRLIISTDSDSPEYTAREDGSNKFTIRLSNSKLQNVSLSRQINTKEFDTAISTISPKALPGATEFVVELAQQVPYTLTQSGRDVYVDVDIPVRSVNEDSPSIPLAKNATPKPAPIAEEKSMDTSSLSEEEAMVSSPKSDKGGARSYRYVKEEFMNDTLSDGETLSKMASIITGAVDGKKFTGRRISLDFKDAEVRSVFRLIADISRFNIIISDDVEGRITIRLDDVPWDQAFAIILQTRGLWFEKYGNIIRVASADKLKKERDSAAAAAAAAKAAKPLDVLFKPVSFAEASTLTKQIQSVLSERGTVDIDSRTNTLIIKDVREHLDKAKRLVDILDTQTPQVTIESRIVEATSTFTRSFGINWSGNARFSSATGNPTGLFFPNSAAISPFALNFPVEAGFINSTANISLGSINNIVDLDLALALGEQEGHSKLISAPKITVLDNKAASITAGSQIPFTTQTANAGSSVRFETAATTLSVTPHITNDGSILMNIVANRNEPNFALLVQGNPIIDQRTASTEVLVKSGNTTVIGGIYSTQSARSQSRFPVLHQIPLIGILFKNYNKAIRRTELLIFVTPRIVGDEREAIREVAE